MVERMMEWSADSRDKNLRTSCQGRKKARQMSGEIRLAKNDQQPNVSRWRPRAKQRVNSPFLKWTKRTTTTMMMNVDYQVDICLRRIATISHRNMRNNVCVDRRPWAQTSFMTRPRPVDGENSNQPQISYQEKSFLGERMRQMTRVISDKIVWWFVNILWFVHEKESPLKSKDNKKDCQKIDNI